MAWMAVNDVAGYRIEGQKVCNLMLPHEDML